MNIFSRISYSPFYTQLVVIRKCNLSCGYCNEYDTTSNPVPKEDLKARLRKLKELGSFSVCLTGGEPTMHPDLQELIRYSRYEAKFLKTAMITNGFYLTPDYIKGLNEAGLQAMQISIDGVEPNETSIKVLKSIEKKLGFLRDHAEFDVIVSGVIGACPPQESFEVIKTAKEMGFIPRVLLLHGPDGQVKLTQEELDVYEKLKTMIPKSLYDFGNRDFREKMIAGEDASFKCRSGSRYLYVNEFGDVQWCSQTPDLFKKPLMEYTKADLKEQFYTYKPCQDTCSLGCVRSSSNVDNWRSQKSA